MDVSTRQLRAFIALVDEGNFTRASRTVHLSQPAFSATIRAIEDAIGFQLVDRNSRGMRLTPEGEKFERIARLLLTTFDEGVKTLGEQSDPQERVAVAAMVALTHHVLPPLFADFKRNSPQAQIELTATFANDCIRSVRERKVDFAVTAVGPGHRNLEVEHLYSEAYELVCHRSHRLASRQSVSIEDLTQHPFVHYAAGTLARQLIDAAVAPLKIQIVHEIEHIHTIRALIENGAGVSLVTKMTRNIFESPELAIIPLEAPGIYRDIGLVWHPDHKPGRAARRMAEIIKATLGD